MKPRFLDAATVRDTTTIPHETCCDDCGAPLADWILTPDNSCLCFACADVWEEFGIDEAVSA